MYDGWIDELPTYKLKMNDKISAYFESYSLKFSLPTRLPKYQAPKTLDLKTKVSYFDIGNTSKALKVLSHSR